MHLRLIVAAFFMALGLIAGAQNDNLKSENRIDTLSLRLIRMIEHHKNEEVRSILESADSQKVSPFEQTLLHFWIGNYRTALSLFFEHYSNFPKNSEQSGGQLTEKIIEVFISEQNIIDRLIVKQVADEDSALFLKISYRAAIEKFRPNSFGKALGSLVNQYRMRFFQGKFISFVNQNFPAMSNDAGQYGYSTALGFGGVFSSSNYFKFFSDRWNLRFDFDYYYRNFSFGVNAENHYTRLNSDVMVNDTLRWEKQSMANQLRIGITGGFSRTLTEKTKLLMRAGAMYGWIFPTGTDIRQQNLPEQFAVKIYGAQTSIRFSHVFKYRVRQWSNLSFQNRIGYGIHFQYQLSIAWFNRSIDSPTLFNGFSVGFYIDSFNQQR